MLDFGGGFGVLPVSVMEALDLPLESEKFEFDIFETPETVRQAAVLWNSKNSRIKFIHDFSSLRKYDLVYSASAIQYVEKYSEVISLICKTNPRWILIEDLFAGAPKTFVTTQHYYGVNIPQYIFNFSEIVSILDSHGYELENSAPAKIWRANKYIELDMENFEKEFRIPHTLSCVFRLKSFD